MGAGLGDFEDFRYLVDKDIRDMADEFAGKRTVANGKIVFGLGRTKKLTGLMHWVQDCCRVNNIPDHNHLKKLNLIPILESCSPDLEGGH